MIWELGTDQICASLEDLCGTETELGSIWIRIAEMLHKIHQLE